MGLHDGWGVMGVMGVISGRQGLRVGGMMAVSLRLHWARLQAAMSSTSPATHWTEFRMRTGPLVPT